MSVTITPVCYTSPQLTQALQLPQYTTFINKSLSACIRMERVTNMNQPKLVDQLYCAGTTHLSMPCSNLGRVHLSLFRITQQTTNYIGCGTI